MFKRDILFHLERWKVDTHRKPLILRGARQVGKTTVVNEFGKQFDNYLYLNLEKREAASLFELNVSSFRLFPSPDLDPGVHISGNSGNLSIKRESIPGANVSAIRYGYLSVVLCSRVHPHSKSLYFPC